MSRWLEASSKEFDIVANGLKAGKSTGKIVDELIQATGYGLEQAFDLFYELKRQFENNFTLVNRSLENGISEGEVVEDIDEDSNTKKFEVYDNIKNNIENQQ